MNIAVCASVENAVPPIDGKYGGAERITDVMCKALKESGHTVTLYCGLGSTCEYADSLVIIGTNRMSDEVEILKLLKNNNPFDCVIDYTAHHLMGQHIDNAWSLMGGDPFKKYPHDEVKNRVYLSREFADFNCSRNHPTLAHPLLKPINEYPFYPEHKDHFVYIGGIHRMKGIVFAIDACRAMDADLHIYGPVRDAEYWENIKEYIDGKKIKYFGELGNKGRAEAFGSAKAFFHMTLVHDADPIAPIEAMCYGTPVIGFPLGGLHTTVEPFLNGFFADIVKDSNDVSKIDQTETLKGICGKMGAIKIIDRFVVRETINRQRNYKKYLKKLNMYCTFINNGVRW